MKHEFTQVEAIDPLLVSHRGVRFALFQHDQARRHVGDGRTAAGSSHSSRRHRRRGRGRRQVGRDPVGLDQLPDVGQLVFEEPDQGAGPVVGRVGSLPLFGLGRLRDGNLMSRRHLDEPHTTVDRHLWKELGLIESSQITY